MVEMHKGQNARIGAGATEMNPDIGALEVIGQEARSQTARPFIEITEHDPRAGMIGLLEDILGEKLVGLVTAL